MAKAVDGFLENLNSEQKKLFHEVYDFIIDRSAEYAADHFVEGIKFGLAFGIECADQNQSL